MKELPEKKLILGDTGQHRAAYTTGGIVVDSAAENMLLLKEGVVKCQGRGTWMMEKLGTADATLSFSVRIFSILPPSEYY